MNNTNPPVNSTEIPTQSTPHPVNNQRGFFPIILGVLMLLVVIGGGAYYLGTQNSSTTPQTQNTNALPATNPQNNTVTNPTDAPVATQTPQTNQVTDWNTYTSQANGFSIQYPKTIAKYQGQWEYKEFPSTDGSVWVGFRPSSVREDYIWGVNIYDNKTVEQVIKEQGQQFNDRKESRKNLTLNGNPALLVTVTTNQYPDWISKTIIVEKNGKVYAISNGAVEIPEFDSFYKSFKTLNYLPLIED